MDDTQKRKKKVQRKDGMPWKSIIAVIVIVGVVLAIAEMGRADRQYRSLANRQALEALQAATQGQDVVGRPALDTVRADDAEHKTQAAEAQAATEDR